MRVHTSIIPIAALLTLAACDVSIKKGGRSTDSVATDSGANAAASAGAAAMPVDSGAAGTGTAAASATSATSATAAATATAGAATASADSASLEVWPEHPRRGGVVFARLKDVGDAPPRCTWNGETLPCHADGGDALIVVPLSADAPAGIFALGVESGGKRATRSVQVQERDFGRELVFLDATTYALTQDAQAVARDSRAVRSVLAGESAERRWGGAAWREPKGQRSAGYGVERFYYRASDSTRAIALASNARTTGTFGTDTASKPRAAGSPPAWRHAGVDIAFSRGTRVEAPAGAIVADVGQYQLTGRTLLLDHGQGVFTAYFHLDSVLVRRGDVVKAGQAVGRVGSTGLSTGPHLHYGVYVHGHDVDPAAWRSMPSWLSPAADSARMAARRGG